MFNIYTGYKLIIKYSFCMVLGCTNATAYRTKKISLELFTKFLILVRRYTFF
jgi:hypothetical protein